MKDCVDFTSVSLASTRFITLSNQFQLKAIRREKNFISWLLENLATSHEKNCIKNKFRYSFPLDSNPTDLVTHSFVDESHIVCIGKTGFVQCST